MATWRPGLRVARLLAAAATLVVLAAACGGDDGDAVDVVSGETTEQAAPKEAPASTTPPSDDDSDGSGDPDDPDGGAGEDSRDDSDEPERLADYLGGLGFGLDPEEAQAYYARQEQRAEELIADCMANEGFEYIPAVRPVPDAAFGSPDDVEFAREWGFGISTSFGEEDFLQADDDWIDPNDAIVEAMSDSERQAYFDALHRPPEPAGTETDPETGETTEVYGGGFGEGCRDQAYAGVYGGEELMQIIEALDLESMWQRIQADPQAREIFGDWSQCMGDRGYDYDDPDDLYQTVYEDFSARLEEIAGAVGGFVDPFEGLSSEEITEQLSNLSDEEIEDLYASAQREAREDVDQAALSALRDEERALAVANAECSKDMAREMEELSSKYEAELIEANRALLEDYREGRGG